MELATAVLEYYY